MAAADGRTGAGRLVAATVAAALMSLPLGAMGTLLLLPFWRRLEAATGVESIGHSGPAGWCYAATTLALFAVVEAVIVVRGGAGSGR